MVLFIPQNEPHKHNLNPLMHNVPKWSDTLLKILKHFICKIAIINGQKSEDKEHWSSADKLLLK